LVSPASPGALAAPTDGINAATSIGSVLAGKIQSTKPANGFILE
jgi:hypothetical protein